MATEGFKRRWMVILWPAFLMAGVLEMAVFALVDPANLHWLGGEALHWSPTAVYTLAFFVFWAIITLAGLMMRLLDHDAEQINRDGASGVFRR